MKNIRILNRHVFVMNVSQTGFIQFQGAFVGGGKSNYNLNAHLKITVSKGGV